MLTPIVLIALVAVVIFFFRFFKEDCYYYTTTGLVTQKRVSEFDQYIIMINVHEGLFLEGFVSKETFDDVQIGKFYTCELISCDQDVTFHQIKLK